VRAFVPSTAAKHRSLKAMGTVGYEDASASKSKLACITSRELLFGAPWAHIAIISQKEQIPQLFVVLAWQSHLN
jgi:hypothetical protein